jgi:hypothetical protein
MGLAPLRTNYDCFIRLLRILALNDLGCVFPGTFLPWTQARRYCMFFKSLMTVLCAAGVAFYLRFLVAVCKECKPRSTGYWVRLRLSSGEDTIAELPEQRRPVSRAA